MENGSLQRRANWCRAMSSDSTGRHRTRRCAVAGRRSVEVDQSALTGESLPATRKPGDAVFSGSIVRRGEIGAVVYATGAKTYFGKTAELVQEAHTISHFQRAVLKIGNYLIILAVALVAVIIAVAIFRGDRSSRPCSSPWC